MHAPGRSRLAPDLLPQHLRHGIPVEAVDDATCLLGIDEFHIQVAGLSQRVGDRVFGDLMEDHSAHRHLGFQDLQKVPGDGLTLAVLVRGEQKFRGTGQLLLEFADALPL